MDANNANELRHAARYGDIDTVKFLVNTGRAHNVNQALIWAAHGGNLSIVMFLVNAGADDLTGALNEAARMGRLSVVQCLVELGADEWEDARWLAGNGNYHDVTAYFDNIIAFQQQMEHQTTTEAAA